MPWATLRSALFAPIRPGVRAAMTRQQIATVGDYRIIYTGIRLDQADLDVYEQVLHLARSTPLGHAVRFKTRALLRTLGRSEGKSDRDWLLKSLSRLSACEIEVSNGRMAYAGSLIHEQGRDDEAGTHYIVLNPRLAALYQQGWAPVRWEDRRALGKQQLAKWLHGFILGQQRPLTFSIANLMELANSNYERERDFRKAFDTAAAALNTFDWPRRAAAAGGWESTSAWSATSAATPVRTSWASATPGSMSRSRRATAPLAPRNSRSPTSATIPAGASTSTRALSPT